MDGMFNYPNNFAYDAKICEVESMERRPISGQCALNSDANTSIVESSILDLMQNKPILPIEDVLSSAIDNMSYHST